MLRQIRLLSWAKTLSSTFETIYLSNDIANYGGAQADVEKKTENIWRSNSIYLKMKMKMKIFNACVKAVLLYVFESWFGTEVIKKKLQAFVN